MSSELLNSSSVTPRDSEAESDSMPKSSATVRKKNRSSGKHSRGGCGTCKIRRVKCDEVKPICNRCQKFGITCDGYQRHPGPPPVQQLPQLPTLVLRPVEPSTFLILPSMLLHNTDNEERYFNLFRDSTSFKIAPFFENDTFRTILLQSCKRDSIRHGVVALAALDQFTDSQQMFPLNLDLANTNEHHQKAVQQYARAVSIMNKDVADGRQDLRTTLLTCLLISLFESFHGNYTLADTQINNGIELLRVWHSNHPDVHGHPLGFSSPDASVVEDGLEHAFGRLEIQRFSFTDNRPNDVHVQRRDGGEEILNDMPEAFQTTYDARIHLELIIRRVKHWLRIVGATYDGFDDDTADSQDTIPLEWFAIPISDLHVPSEFLDMSDLEELERQRQIHLKHCQIWIESFETMSLQNERGRDTIGASLLRIGCKAIKLILMTSLNSDPMIFDSFTSEMIDIVDLTAQVINRFKDNTGSKIDYFSLDFGPFIPLYYVALNCRVSSVRRQAIDLLQKMPRRQAAVSSNVAARTADWIRQIEEQHMDFMGVVPTWARVSYVGTDLDHQAGGMSLVCKQGEMTEFGLVKTERRTVLGL